MPNNLNPTQLFDTSRSVIKYENSLQEPSLKALTWSNHSCKICYCHGRNTSARSLRASCIRSIASTVCAIYAPTREGSTGQWFGLRIRRKRRRRGAGAVRPEVHVSDKKCSRGETRAKSSAPPGTSQPRLHMPTLYTARFVAATQKHSLVIYKKKP